MSSRLRTDSLAPQQETSKESDDVERKLPKDDLFHLLQSSRRRATLAYLRERDEEVTLGELAEHIAAWENDKRVRNLTSKERQSVYISLYQIHLEKLEKHGVVEFSKSRGLVTRTANAVQLYPYIDTPLTE